jgi:histidyl-tRNA synthetase
LEIKDDCYKGTRILLGNKKRDLIDKCIKILREEGFEEISIPIIQPQALFEHKVGEENQNMMFNFTDRGDRNLCLAPEYTAVIQQLALHRFKYTKEKKVFYVQECFRGESPQAGRYRQFTQLGVEVINPVTVDGKYLTKLALSLISQSVTPCDNTWYKEVYTPNIKVNTEATRGLDYYTGGQGFEISYEGLGAQKQICGGGSYDGGTGFALGIDRLLLIENE